MWILHFLSYRLFSWLLAYLKPHLCQETDIVHTAKLLYSVLITREQHNSAHSMWEKKLLSTKLSYVFAMKLVILLFFWMLRNYYKTPLRWENTKLLVHCHWGAISLTLPTVVRDFPKILLEKIWLTKINGAKLLKWVLLDMVLLTPHTAAVKKNPTNPTETTSPPTDS